MLEDNPIRPFEMDIHDSELDELRARLLATRWPSAETAGDWSQGVPLGWMKDITDYWANSYDWRAREKPLSQFDHFVTTIDSVDVHFIHAPSPHPGAVPVIMTHGWPGSFVEFLKVIEPLRNPTAFGGSAEDAMSVVVPSLPGFGFSGKPAEPGWTIERIAQAWDTLMQRLGYKQYIMNGTDWGAHVCMAAAQLPTASHIQGLALNLASADPTGFDFEPNAEEEAFHRHNASYFESGHGYSAQQSTRPQAVGYALDDSPVGQAAWILDKFSSWVDYDKDMGEVLSRDELLDNIMLYWLNRAGASSARLYFESFNSILINMPTIGIPSTYTRAKDVFMFSEREIRTRFTDLRRYGVVQRGGHFLAFEQPQIFIDDLRSSVRALTN